MKIEWGAPQVKGDAVVYCATATLEIKQIAAHPDRFLADVGDTYQGVAIIRDASIPLDEIHVIEGNRRVIMHFARNAP
jgi:hypothetical protein